MKVGDHIIPQVTRFKYLGSVIQNDGEIGECWGSTYSREDRGK